MSSPPLVSVIIPTYQCGHLVARAVESVLNQTYPEVELIVVNDGSTDGTDEVLRPYLESLVYINQEINRGITVAYNTGIGRAKGDYIAFLSADDYFLPERLSAVMAELRQEDKCFATTDYYREVAGDEGNWLPPVYSDDDERFTWDAATQLTAAMSRNFIFGQVVLPRLWFDEVGYFDQELSCHEDWDMWLRGLAAGYRAILIPEQLSVYTVARPGSLTLQNTSRKAQDNKRILAKHKHAVSRRAYRVAQGNASWNIMRAAQISGHYTTALMCALEVIGNGPYLKGRLLPKLLAYLRPSIRR